MQNKKKKFFYPKEVTHNFDYATFHINYCLSFIKKYLKGDILEVGAGNGSFTKNYINSKINSLILTDRDKYNTAELLKFFKNRKIKITNKSIDTIHKKFDAICYFHVLEHIKNDNLEIRKATNKLKKNGKLIILVPAHQRIYSNLDKYVGHYRRYEKKFFRKKYNLLRLIEFKYLDSSGYILYILNKFFFKKEQYPSTLKIMIWDKIFTPISFILDFLFRYKVGKCILAVYKRK